MPRSLSRSDPPQGYIRTTTKQPHYTPSPYDPHSVYLDSQLSPQSHVETNTHPPAYHHHFNHDSYYRHPHGEVPFYHPYGGYVPPFHKPDFRHPYHYRPLPHPPAPPAPPRPQQPRQAHSHTSSARPGSRSPLRPAVSYHPLQAEPNPHNVPPGPMQSCSRTQPSRDHGNEASSGHTRPEGDACTRSLSLGSRSESETQEQTPSPVDPDGIRRWEEEHSQSLPSQVSPGGGSYHEGEMVNNGGDGSAINPSLRNSSCSGHSSLSREFDSHDSAADELSSHDSRADGISGAANEVSGEVIPNPQQRPNTAYYPLAHHQAQFAALAKETGNTQRSTGLNSLADGSPSKRPPYSIPTIIKCAILGSPHEQLTVDELYLAMEERFPYYQNHNKKSWKNSVRHTLSLKKQFVQKVRPITEPGKSQYWVVRPDEPEGNKRVRKRNKKLGKRALAAMAAEQARLALLKEQELNATDNTDSNISTDSTKSTDVELPIDPRLTGVPPAYPGSVRGAHISGTVPANAGSYAAVTGAIPPPALEKYLFRQWHGDVTSPQIDLSRLAVLPSITQQDSEVTQQPSSSNTSDRSEQTLLQDSSNTLGTSGSSAGASLVALQQPVRVSSSLPPAPEDTSASGVHRTSKTRVDRRCNPMAVGPSASTPPRRSAFETLSAALEREGIGAKGSGGPASRARRPLGRSNRRESDGDDSESDGDPNGDQSGDEDYGPRNHRLR